MCGVISVRYKLNGKDFYSVFDGSIGVPGIKRRLVNMGATDIVFLIS